MVKDVRNAEKSIGKVDYNLTDKQKKGKDFSRSIYVIKDMKEGEVITKDNVAIIRPGFGLHPKHYDSIIGKNINRSLERGDRISLEDLV